MKKISILLIIALFITSVFASEIASSIWLARAAPGKLNVPTDYPNIQTAINAASLGDTISVAPGVYFENVVVNKTVSLIGDNIETTVIDGNGMGPVVRITAAGSAVSGFTIQNASEGGTLSFVGVCAIGTSNSNISGNIIRENWMGIYMDGSSHNIVEDNIIANNTYGIYLSQSGLNNIDRNTVVLNRYGFVISLYQSGGNILRSNNMSQNSQNFKLLTVSDLRYFIQDIDTSNTVDGKPVYYWMNQNDKQVPSDAGYVAIINSTKITVKDAVLTRNGEGILIAYTMDSVIDNVNSSNNLGVLGGGIVVYHSNNNYILRSIISNNTGSGILLDTSHNNIILGNTMVSNAKGAELFESLNNVIFGNAISDSRAFGIDALDSGNNTIYHNSFIANAVQVSSRNSLDSWNMSYPSGGNYWSDYAGTDSFSGSYQNQTGSDGIGDTPYVIDSNNTDEYPLMVAPLPIPAFLVSVSPFSQNVKPGQSVTYVVTVISVNNFDSEVSLSGRLIADNSDLSFAFDPAAITPPVNGSVKSILTVTAVLEAAPSAYIVVVNATSGENCVMDAVEINVLDVIKPKAEAGPDQTVNENTEVTFDGSESSDNVAVVHYVWIFVDVTPRILLGVHPTYGFNNPGKFVVTMNVTDAGGNWATDDVTITVLDITQPLANAGQNQTVVVGSVVTFDGSNSTDNVGVVSYEWDFGDGNTGTGASATHTYTKPGTYIVKLVVKDATGNSDTATVIITVNALPDTSFLFLGLVVALGVTISGLALGTLYWKSRKRLETSPVTTSKKVDHTGDMVKRRKKT